MRGLAVLNSEKTWVTFCSCIAAPIIAPVAPSSPRQPPLAARSSIIITKPEPLPRPCTAGGEIMKMLAPLICPAIAPVSWPASASALCCLPRWDQSFSLMKNTPAFDAWLKLAPSRPAKAAPSITPSVLAAMA